MVVKADGLAAGKGVVVADDKAEAKAAVRRMLSEGAFGAAGARVVIEERLTGREVSMMALCDGERLALLPSSEDHKTVGDGDQGPNTGGMGTYSPSPLVDAASAQRIVETLFVPTVRALAAAGRPFRGAALRRPDADARSRADGDRMELPLRRSGDAVGADAPRRGSAALAGGRRARARCRPGAPRARPGVATCVVLAAARYPESPRLGDAIAGLPRAGRRSAGRSTPARAATAAGW